MTTAASVGQLPALEILVPMVAAPLIVLLRRPRLAWWIALAASSTCAVIAWQLLAHVREHGPVRYAIGGWSAPTGIEYYIDPLNAVVLLLVSGISSVVLLYARSSVDDSIAPDRHYLFYAAWLLCLTGLLGITITGDAFNVFVFLEISSLATYMLIAFGRDRRALTASFNYLVLGSVGASFILIGIGFLYAATGTLNMIDLAHRLPDAESERAVLVAFSFLTIGLMIKAAIFPLHAWLANAYAEAPIAVTAFLAGTATKVSLYVIVRFFYSIFGADYSFGSLFLNGVLLPAAVAGFVLMSLVAVFQTDLKRMLAYSSVAQIGYIVAGLSLATESGLTAAIVHVVNHGLVKTTLFMAVGCLIVQAGHCHKPSLIGLGRRMPFTCAAFALAGAALIGVPLSAGFVSKFQLIGALLERDLWPIAALTLFSSLLSAVYIGRTLEILLFDRDRVDSTAAPDDGSSPSAHATNDGAILPANGPSSAVAARGIQEAPIGMVLSTWLLLGIMLYAGTHGGATLTVAHEAARGVLDGLIVVPVEVAPAVEAALPAAGAHR